MVVIVEDVLVSVVDLDLFSVESGNGMVLVLGVVWVMVECEVIMKCLCESCFNISECVWCLCILCVMVYWLCKKYCLVFDELC